MPASSAIRARGARGGHRVKRWLYLTHRWIGIVSCILFAMWFLSGLVMIYVPYPSLGGAERVAGLLPIDFGRVRVQPGAAARTAGIAIPERMALEMRADRPVWRVRDWDGSERVVDAADGAIAAPAGRDEAARIASLFAHAPVTRVEPLQRDQWTVAGGYDRDRPLWKMGVAGTGGREVYVSSRTGAVVLRTDAHQRFWNWLGSVPHWLYPTVLRQDNAAWRQVVMWVSGPCVAGAVTGMWIGMLRVRMGRRRFAQGRAIPYHGWMAWHHVAGLVGGVALIAWIFSGWLSVDPFRLFAQRTITVEQRMAFAGASSPPRLDLAALSRGAARARRVELRDVAGRPLLSFSTTSPSVMIDASTLRRVMPDPAMLVAASHRLVPDAAIKSVERLTAPDAYWYEIGDRPPLPVLRVRFDDAAGTWVHIDPATGTYLGLLDNKRRTYRWLFDLLHKWDLNALNSRRPLWDVVLWLLSAFGLVTSATGIWIAVRRLSRKPARQPAGHGV